MHGAIQLLLFWALAFLSLGIALVCLNIFSNLIGDGLDFLSLGKETAIAAIASLVEAVSVCLLITYVPAAIRAMFFPALVVACIYKVAHYEDWNRYEIILLLLFQVAVGCLGACLFLGQFRLSMVVVFWISVVLIIVAFFAKFFDIT